MWERELRGGLKRLMPFWLHILLILKQKSKRVNVKIKFRKDLSNSTMGKMSIKKPQFRESRGAIRTVVMHRRSLSHLIRVICTHVAPFLWRSRLRALHRDHPA